jgi:prepilin-type N-terminal cleavage/methylation domain-containing protein
MRNQKGFTLIEVLVSVALVGILGTAFLTSLTHSTYAVHYTDQLDNGRALAQSQMEYIKEQKYSASGYTPSSAITSRYPGYSVNISVSTPGQTGQRDSLLQNVTVTVSQNTQIITTLEGFKTKR